MTSTATVSSKGQVTLPAWARERLGLGPGAKLVVRIEGERLVLERIGRTLDELQGSLRHLYRDVDEVLAEIREGRRDRDELE